MSTTWTDGSFRVTGLSKRALVGAIISAGALAESRHTCTKLCVLFIASQLCNESRVVSAGHSVMFMRLN